MSEPSNDTATIDPLSTAAIGLFVAVAVVVGAYIVGGAIAGNAGLSAVTSLLFGWLLFLDRSLGAMQPDVPSLLLGTISLLILFVAVHRLGRQASIRLRSAAADRWTWRSTVAVTLVIVLLFGAGVAIVGGTHQLLWLTAGRHPLRAKWRAHGGPLSQMLHAAQVAQSRNTLKQLMLGMHNYHDTFSQFPPGAIMLADGRGYRGWLPPLGPYIDFQDPWAWYDQAWDGPEVTQFGKGALPFLMHPELGWHGQFDDRGFALMHYAGNMHIFPNNRGMRISEFTDGTSNTLTIGEIAENFQPWASPWNRRDPADGINDVPWGFGGPPWQHGAQFAMADGSVRFISKNIDRKVLRALGTPNADDDPGAW